jgi:hypothetical protein
VLAVYPCGSSGVIVTVVPSTIGSARIGAGVGMLFAMAEMSWPNFVSSAADRLTFVVRAELTVLEREVVEGVELRRDWLEELVATTVEIFELSWPMVTFAASIAS